MMLPPRKRIADLRRVLQNERRAMEARFPTNGHEVHVLPPHRADYATFETDSFRRLMSGRRSRFGMDGGLAR